MAKPPVKSWKITSHASVSQQGLKLCPACGETEAQGLTFPKVGGLCSDAPSVTSTGFSLSGCGSLPRQRSLHPPWAGNQPDCWDGSQCCVRWQSQGLLHLDVLLL